MSPVIDVRNLTRTFGDVRAVDDLSFTVERGTFFGFLGPNGAGKSTTINMLTGLIPITSGSAELLGFDVKNDPVEVKRRIGIVPEKLALFERLTGAEYLDLTGRLYGLDRHTIRSRSEELLELWDLADHARKLIVDYSHGMKKKLALSAALIHEPALLFLDEPFEGVDAIASRLIKEILNRLAGRGVTIFLTSHILEIVEKLCSDVAILHRGKLVAHGPLSDLQKGIRIDDASRTATLEEIFINLVDSEEQGSRSLSWLT